MIWLNSYRGRGMWRFCLALAVVAVAWVGGQPGQSVAQGLGDANLAEGAEELKPEEDKDKDKDKSTSTWIRESGQVSATSASCDPSTIIGENVTVGSHDGYPSGHLVGTYYVEVCNSNKAIIVIHGADSEGCIVGQTKCDNTLNWAGAWFSKEMVNKGYTVISMDYHGDYEHSLYVDIQTVVDYYAQKFSLSRIALFGQSHGGLNLTRGLWKTDPSTFEGTVLQTGMDVSGPVDIVDLWQYISNHPSLVLRLILKPRLETLLKRPGNCGVPDPKNKDLDGLHVNCEEHWRAFSPAYVRPKQGISDCNVQDGACAALGLRPFFLTHSDKDDRVPERQAFALCDGLLRRPHIAIAYYLLKGLPHGFMNNPYDQSVKVLGKFLEFLSNPNPTDTVCRAPL